jgi:hypothetical protein
MGTGSLLACTAWLTLTWRVAAQRRLVARAARRFVSLPRVEQTLLVLAVGVMTVFDFSAPEGVNYATNWMLHGGATARTRPCGA